MRLTKKKTCDFPSELVFLEQLCREPDNQGGMRTEWRPLEPLWAKIEAQKPGSFTEQWQGERPHFAARYWVWLRQEHILPSVYRLWWGTSVLTPISAMTRLPGQEWQMVLMQQQEAE